MEDKIYDIVTDLIRDDISKDEAIDKLLVLYNVSSSTCDEIFTQAAKSDWDEPVIKHFRDDNEDSKYTNWDSLSIGGFSDW
jgi:hypothetical protein